MSVEPDNSNNSPEPVAEAAAGGPGYLEYWDTVATDHPELATISGLSRERGGR